jgi:SAM-dependent methyltransferase
VTRYALLALPAANRVYRATAPALATAELRLLGAGPLHGRLREVARAEVAGVPYLTFAAPDAEPLGPADLAVLGHLSVFYALFAVEGASSDLLDAALLRPVVVPPGQRFDDDLVTIPKYVGKTNEQFTRLLLNVTVAASVCADRLATGGLAVFDPLSGRGTTLNHALLAGHDAAGIELDGKHVEAYAAFLRTWLQRKRLKHRVSFAPVRRSGVQLGRRFTAEFAASKQAFEAGNVRRVDVVHADTLRAGEFFRPASFDVVVADVPYGVQHASRSTARQTGRSPLALLEQALPVWVRLLRPGGAVGLAWNTLVAPRAELVALFAGVGLQPLDDGAYRDLEHRVDQAIVRDVVVGRLPAP